MLALVGAFGCGAIYLLAGMIPSREEPFWRRTFTSVFLSVVVSSLVLILPGTMGAQALHPEVVKHGGDNRRPASFDRSLL